jgi:uncharacterized membrane protein (UPF0136 family)
MVALGLISFANHLTLEGRDWEMSQWNLNPTLHTSAALLGFRILRLQFCKHFHWVTMILAVICQLYDI